MSKSDLGGRRRPPVADPASEAARCRRVHVLLVGIIVLSLADLIVTLVHLSTIGMIEANPIAAWLIRSTESPWVLVLYKLTTMSICVTLLFRFARYVACEVAAWSAMVILAGMSVLWYSYSESIESPVELRIVQVEQHDAWLRLD